jgi:hypothetical protein
MPSPSSATSAPEVRNGSTAIRCAASTTGPLGRLSRQPAKAPMASMATPAATSHLMELFPPNAGPVPLSVLPIAELNSAMFAKRSFGSVASAFTSAASVPSGTPARTDRMRGRGPVMLLVITDCAVGPENACWPASIS